MNILRMRDIHCSFEPGVPVLDGIDLKITSGEVVGLLGRNGTSFLGSFSKPAPESSAGIDAGVTLENSAVDPYRGRISADRSRTAVIVLMVLSVLITAVMLPALFQYGSWVHRKLFKRASIAFLILLVTAVVAISGARFLGFTQVWHAGVLISIGLRSLSHVLPLPPEFLWILCVTFWVGAYLILRRVFAKIEFPRVETTNHFAEEY